MIGSSPIRLQDGIKLSQKGIPAGCFKADSLSIQSNKYLAIKVPTGNEQQLTIIDLPNGTNVRKIPMTGAEGAIMHPSRPILAIRAAQTLQLYNLEDNRLLITASVAEPVVFWTWINETTIGIVGPNNVYHWAVNTTQAQLVFARSPDMANVKITAYSVNPAMTWCFLVGITPENNKVVGRSQFFSVELQAPQSIPALAATMCNINYQGQDIDVLAFVSREESGFSLTMIQPTTTTKLYEGKRLFFNLKGMRAENDFPIFINFNKRFGFVTIFSREGNFTIYDVGTGVEIVPPSGDKPLFASTATINPNEEDMNNQALIAIAVASNGDVMNLVADTRSFIPYITHSLHQHDLAFKLASQARLGGAEDLFREQFERLFSMKNYTDASKLVLSSGPNLRTETMMQRFMNEPPTPGQPAPILVYLNTLMQGDGQVLTDYETVTLVRLLIGQGATTLLENMYNTGKLTITTKAADIIRSSGLQGMDALAIKMYTAIKAHDKVIIWMVESNQTQLLVPYIQKLAQEQAMLIGTPTSPKPLDFISILRSVVNSNPDASTVLALLIVNPPEEIKASGIIPLIDVEAVIRIYEENQYVKEATKILLELCNLGSFGEETGPYQTRLLELNLRSANPQVADSMLAKDVLHYYDKDKISKLCEKAGLYERALLLYSNIDDVKRCVVHTEKLSVEFFVQWSSNLTAEDAMLIYKEMLQNNQSQHTIQLIGQSVIQAQKDRIAPNEVMDLLLSFSRGRSDNKIDEAMYYYLGSIVNGSTDPDVFYQYVVSATRMHNNVEVERICRDTAAEYLEPVKDKLHDFLQDSPELKTDPKQNALSIIAVRFGFVEDVIKYYFKSSRFDAIEFLVTDVSPASTGLVIGILLDMDCDSAFIGRLCMSVRSICDVNEMAARLEERGRIRLLKKMIIARMQEGVTDPAVHTVFGKVLVECEVKNDASLSDFGVSSREFIQQNKFYDHKSLGNFCEKRDPTLAFMCYASDPTETNESGVDLIRVSNENALHKLLARYLIRKASPQLWNIALSPETNPDEANRKILIDKVITQAIPEAVQAGNEEGVTIAIRSFSLVGLHQELIELLEKIVIDTRSLLAANTGNADMSATIRSFANNQSLQTLLITTSIAVDKARVVSYVKKLDNFDAEMTAPRAIAAGLYEEAFLMYTKFRFFVEALNVLLEHIGFQRAEDYVMTLTTKSQGKDAAVDAETGRKLWTNLGRAQLARAEALMNGEDAEMLLNDSSAFGGEDPSVFFCRCALASFIKGEAISYGDSSSAINVAMQLTLYNELIPYLIMNRQQQVKDANIDTALCECYARASRLEELSAFVENKDQRTGESNNLARVQYLADLLFEEGDLQLCRACVVLYRSINGWSSLTSCYLFLGEYENALKSAAKAKSSQVWRQVMAKSIDACRFDVAQAAAQSLIMGTNSNVNDISSPVAGADNTYTQSTDPDELEYVVEYYESRGLIPQLLSLHEKCAASVTVNRSDVTGPEAGNNMLIIANKPLFTSHGKLICKYVPNAYMQFLQAHHHQCNVSQLIGATKQAHLFKALVYLYTVNEEIDNALQTMIEHPVAFDHEEMKRLLSKCISLDLVYRVICCYAERYPHLLVDLLKTMTDGCEDTEHDTGDAHGEYDDVDLKGKSSHMPRIEIARVLQMLCPRIISPFLLFEYLMTLPVHLTDTPVVNEQLFDMLINSCEYAVLERLVCGNKACNNQLPENPVYLSYTLKRHANFDSVALAAMLEKHQLVFFRRIASALYRSPSVRRFSHSILVSKRDYLYSDVVKTVQLSADPQLVKSVMEFFLTGDIIKEVREEVLASIEVDDIREVREQCVAALLYRCYEFTDPADVVATCYLNHAIDICMPYIIQKIADNETFKKTVTEEIEELKKKKEEAQEAPQFQSVPVDMNNATFEPADNFTSNSFGGFADASFNGNATW